MLFEPADVVTLCQQETWRLRGLYWQVLVDSDHPVLAIVELVQLCFELLEHDDITIYVELDAGIATCHNMGGQVSISSARQTEN